MRIYYFVHLTGRDTGNTGIQRVVRCLGRALQLSPDIQLAPVRWSHQAGAIVHAERDFLECLAMFGGPSSLENEEAGRPIHAAKDASDFEDTWLVIPEVPHLASHDARFPSVQVPALLGYARTHGLRTAIIFHDLLPLTWPTVTDEEERQKQAFVAYGHSLANADIVFPVSWASAHTLLDWLRGNGFRSEILPPIKPVPLAEEMPQTPRKNAVLDSQDDFPRTIKLVSLGTVCRRKNQLKALEAFSRIRVRHPSINMEFHLVGNIDPELAGSIACQVARAHGSIKVHGFVTDEKLLQIIGESYATVFVSLAEGFGLPIAESLWLGKPCLCSNMGSMAEIAQGGGCLSVDPTNMAAIEAGLERLVTDAKVYNELLKQLDARELRSWQDYAGEIRNQLREVGSQVHTQIAEISSRWAAYQPAKHLLKKQLLQLEPEELRNWLERAFHFRKKLDENGRAVDSELAEFPFPRVGQEVLEAGQRSFYIHPEDLHYHECYLKRGKEPIFDQKVIRYRRENFSKVADKIKETALFYGPYISLKPGRYLFSIDGEVTGTILINFAKDIGKVIKNVTLSTLNETITLDLPEPIDKFEIVAEKLDETEYLEVRSIFVEYLALEALS